MDITFIFPQKRFRIFPASSRLVLEVADGIYSISDAAVNPHIGIGRIFPSRFFQHLYMCFIDMKVSLFQKLQLQTVDDVYKPVPIDNQKPV